MRGGAGRERCATGQLVCQCEREPTFLTGQLKRFAVGGSRTGGAAVAHSDKFSAGSHEPPAPRGSAIAWHSCLPTWLAAGREADSLSHGFVPYGGQFQAGVTEHDPARLSADLQRARTNPAQFQNGPLTAPSTSTIQIRFPPWLTIFTDCPSTRHPNTPKFWRHDSDSRECRFDTHVHDTIH